MQIFTAQNIIGVSARRPEFVNTQPLTFMTSRHCSSPKSSTNTYKLRLRNGKDIAGATARDLCRGTPIFFSFPGGYLTEDGQKTPHSKFTFDSARDSPESEICRELRKGRRDCMTVCRSFPDLFSTETIRLPTSAEDGLQAAIRVYAGSGVLLRSAVRPLADSYGMHSYTEELRIMSFTKCFKA